MNIRKQSIVVDSADRAWLAKLGFTSVNKVLKYKPDTVAAMSGSSDTFPVEVGSGDGAPQGIYVKRYRYRGLAARLKGLFRGTLFGKSRARFEFEFLAEMRRRGIPAVRPIAFGEKRSAGLLKACFLITEGQTDAPSLDSLAPGPMGSILHDRLDRARLIEALARVLGNMHRAGVKHGGLFWRNILVTRAADGAWRFHLIDPDRGGRCGTGTVAGAGVVSDLADFVSSGSRTARGTDLVRFLRAYFQIPRLTARAKKMAHDIVREARKRAAQEDHRLAMGESIDWLRRRIERARTPGRESSYEAESVPDFFAALAGARRRHTQSRRVTGKVHFTFPTDDQGLSDRYTVTLTPDGAEVTSGLDGSPDLAIQTDPQTWLAIVNGKPEAFELLGGQRIRIEGETSLLPAIAELIDD